MKNKDNLAVILILILIVMLVVVYEARIKIKDKEITELNDQILVEKEKQEILSDEIYETIETYESILKQKE